MSLSAEELLKAADQAQKFQPISNTAIRELLKNVSRVGSTAMGSDQKKSHMLAQLKSSTVFFGCPSFS